MALLQGVAERRQHGVVEGIDGAAAVADQVVMALGVDQLELADAAAEVGLADQAEITKQLERAVDRRAVDRRQPALDAAQYLVGGNVLIRLQGAQDDEPLGGDALANGAEPLGQAVRRVVPLPACWEGGGLRLIVSVQHDVVVFPGPRRRPNPGAPLDQF